MLNIQNRTIYNHDNLDVLKGINSSCIDLIYIDPPFNKKKEFTAPIGSSAEGASFKDWFREEDVKDEWLQTIKEDYDGLYNFLSGVKTLSSIHSSKANKYYLYNYCYLSYMAIRLIEMHRILKDTGSIYLHCDPTMSHYLKILMDIIFGEKNFRNEIAWLRKQGEKHNLAQKKMTSSHDIVFWYVKSDKYKYNTQYNTYSEKYIDTSYKFQDEFGKYSTFPCTNEAGGNKEYEFRGIIRAWRFSPEKMETMYQNNMLTQSSPKSPFRYKKYLDVNKGVKLGDLWIDIHQPRGKERTGYPTQKPLKLLERIIKASSNEGDVVLDAFCGCATTCVASEKLNRQWIGIDISYKAYELVQKRLSKEVEGWEASGQGDIIKHQEKTYFKTTPPNRTDGGQVYKEEKYVYIITHPNYEGMYKVGIAKDYKSRLNSYQTSDPLRQYKLIYQKKTENYREIETYIHKKYKALGEWVSGDLTDIKTDIENFKTSAGIASPTNDL